MMSSEIVKDIMSSSVLSAMDCGCTLCILIVDDDNHNSSLETPVRKNTSLAGFEFLGTLIFSSKALLVCAHEVENREQKRLQDAASYSSTST